MKNGYNGARLEELISKYTKSEDKIIIEFLDGTKYSIPLTAENEAKLLEEMLTQAKDRDNNVSIEYIEKRRRRALINFFLYLALGTANSAIYFGDDSQTNKIFSGVLGAVSILCTLMCGMSYKFNNDEIKELKKYRLYLSMIEELEKNTDPNLFEGISKSMLNINTLDNYSLREIERLKKNLIRSKEYSDYFSGDSENHVLIKK